MPITVCCLHVQHAAHCLASHFVSSVVLVFAATDFAMCPCHSLHMHAVRGTFRHRRQSNGTPSWSGCYPFPPLDVTQVLRNVLLARTSTKLASSCAVLAEKLYFEVAVRPFNLWGSARYIIARFEVLMSVLARIQLSRYIVSGKSRRYIAWCSWIRAS